ncbi:polysaccharide deacetylase family protein [Microvirga sp. STR05]|uniref:Polysaccharide deacetylase family protein n=1 Tax=Hymenobacter duratus TaxID=2771356 RepID=A0ABR8JKB6_9BACT|nr:glycosyltransferase [Hymenobacter duratus]MBD2715825.1 polysaccharide deacetylase family protein [Hymenobacter duratus]MBR7950736.1 polysaccharide deacetylase family protein [Microvirga sp. STR05]
MRILHVLSANFFAGSVSYAVHLADAHRAQGHEVWLLSDAGTLPTAAHVEQLPISNRRHPQRLRNIRRIRQLVQQQQIEVVHAHSRAASWVAYFALRGLKVPLVSTVHGRQHLHTSTSLFDIYGDKVIAICANLRQHLIEEVKMRSEKIVLLPNGVDFDEEALGNAGSFGLRLSFIGRFNGGKGERAAALLQQVFPQLLTEFVELRLALVGGELEHLPEAGKTALAGLRQQFGARVEVVGFSDDVPGWLRRSTLVIGAGRVAIEALGAGVPVLALGEATCEGIVTEASYPTAAASNFGDISAQVGTSAHVEYAALLAQVREFLVAPAAVPAALQQRARTEFSLARISAEVLTAYRSAIMKKRLPGFLPVLMYHKIPTEPLQTRHRIFVTKDRFEEHLRFFRQQQFTPITFLDYLAFANGERPLADLPARPLILTFDDGYLDNYTNLLPLMQQYGYRGVLYLLGDPAIRYNYWDVDTDPTEPRSDIMDEAQKRAFVAAGWEIGAHTMRHARLPELPLPEAAREIRESKTALEQALATRIVSFAYPYGALTEAHKQQVHEAGFAFGVATDTGGLHLEDDRMQVFRVNMFPEETTATLRKKTSFWYRAYYRWKRGK